MRKSSKTHQNYAAEPIALFGCTSGGMIWRSDADAAATAWLTEAVASPSSPNGRDPTPRAGERETTYSIAALSASG